MAARTPSDPDVRRIQQRTVALLAGAQVFGGIGAGATVSIGSILAVELSGSSAWAGVVATAMTLGAAVAAVPLAALADRSGRRISQVAGLLTAFGGTVLMVLATVTGLFPLLLLGAAGIGVGSAAGLQARFAAVDLAAAGSRGKALSTVVWAVTVGAVAGPNLIRPGAAVGLALGLPSTAGPFVISGTGLLVAVVIVFAGLRPDPLQLARELAAAVPRAPAKAEDPAGAKGSLARGFRAIQGSAGARLAVAAVVAAHAVMVGIMSMTPLHLQHVVEGPAASQAGHHASADALVVIGFTISLHIAGMYALSPVMGWLTDRAGRIQTIMIGLTLLLVAAAVAGLGQGSTTAVAVGLVLLGMGWSAATVAGSTLLAESVDPDSRVVVQGVSDMLMGAAGAVGGAVSGLVLSWAGYPGLNMLGAVIGAGVLAVAFLSLAARRRQSAPD